MLVWLVAWVLPLAVRGCQPDCLCIDGACSPSLPASASSLELRNSNLTRFSLPPAPLPVLRSLDLSENRLEEFALPAPSDLPSLARLNLSLNRMLDFPSGLGPSLESLDLHGNRICNWSLPLPALGNLTFLDLSSNNLSVLRPTLFQPLRALRHLDLSRNSLTNISNDLLWGLPLLEFLDLSHNDIAAVGLVSFRNLRHLRHLDLSHNSLLNLQDNCLRHLTRLSVLNLSHNPLRRLPALFSTLGQLEDLRLSHLWKLRVLESGTLQGLEALHRLDLSWGALEVIQPGSLAQLGQLREIDLSHNNLTTLPRYLLRPLEELQTADLRGNRWHCDCSLYWLLLWLAGSVGAHLESAESTHCRGPGPLAGQPLLESLDHRMTCVNVSIRDFEPVVLRRVGSTVRLRCDAEGVPAPQTSWFTPHGEFRQDPRHYQTENGTLVIQDLRRGDNGFYHCVVTNPLGTSSARVRLALDYDFLVRVKLVSLLVGLGASVGFLLLTLIGLVICAILRRCGVEAPCLDSPRTQQIRRILEGMEQYKSQQLERLRENYTFQVQRIKDNCLQQMERLRDSYSGQVEHLRNIRDYGNHQIDRIRDNYYFQVQRVRDYSACQIDWLRENYIFQRNRIRKFSTHQLVRLRENYKLQQQHLNKILETLNLESCKTACSRTDSMMMEPDLEPPLPFVVEPGDDSSSQMSAYFTPEESDTDSPTTQRAKFYLSRDPTSTHSLPFHAGSDPPRSASSMELLPSSHSTAHQENLILSPPETLV